MLRWRLNDQLDLKLPCAILCAQATILANLKDPDVSIRRRALDLLFTMCDGGAAVEVVEELVSASQYASGSG